MSSLVVREYGEQLCRVFMPEAPFQQTLGVLWQQKNLPEVWSTVEYSNAASQRLTVGKSALWQELGSMTINVLGKSGFGEKPLLRLMQHYCDSVVDLSTWLTEESGIRGRFVLANVGIPNCEPFEDGNWLIGSVVSVYTYTSVRGARDE